MSFYLLIHSLFLKFPWFPFFINALSILSSRFHRRITARITARIRIIPGVSSILLQSPRTHRVNQLIMYFQNAPYQWTHFVPPPDKKFEASVPSKTIQKESLRPIFEHWCNRCGKGNNPSEGGNGGSSVPLSRCATVSTVCFEWRVPACIVNVFLTFVLRCVQCKTVWYCSTEVRLRVLRCVA